MARISTYATDGTIVDGDKVIGSDANNDLITKNYRIGDLVAYFAVAIGDYLVPYVNATSDVNLGQYSLLASNLELTDEIVLNGSSGLPGQVIISQGNSAPAQWGYIIGSQTLQNVLNQGNVGDKSVILNTLSKRFVADVDGVHDSSVNVYIKDKVTNDVGQFYTNKITLQEASANHNASYESDEIIYTETVFGSTVKVKPTYYNNQTFLYPNVGGAFVMSVNGVPADLSGNVTVPIGSGNVESVGVIPGTGISASVANPTTTPVISISNTAPDQTVVLNDGTGISVTGTYPNFTISATGATSPLVALPFTTDHLTATNNQYVIGDIVWYLGNVYRCIANNDSILPTSTLYWTNLGAGFPLVQQPSDWNSTSGNNQILNKPTIPTVGTWGALNYPTWVSGTPFVKMTAIGTFSLDTNTYLTDAPSDGATYGRKNGDWSAVTAESAGFEMNFLLMGA